MMEGPLSFLVNNFPLSIILLLFLIKEKVVSHQGKGDTWFNYLLKSNIDGFPNEWFIEFFHTY